ncbi:MAG: C25 family cysteine peptidase, partial [Thermoplasmatota archaeon]
SIVGDSQFWNTTAAWNNDTQAQIRRFIKYAYMNWHTDYVLLAGDADLPGTLEYSNTVPARYLFCSPDDGDPTDSYAQEMPSDVYYSNLDGTFNGDGDNLWGEPNDGPNGGPVDLRAEVYVGRAPVDNAAEISNFVRKTLAYEDSTDDYLNNVTLFAEYLGFGGVAEYASGNLDMLINGSANHGVVTTGFPAEPPADDRYNVERLYDEIYGGDNAVTGAMVVERINDGTHIIIHDGHGSEDWVLEMSERHYSYYGEPNNWANMVNDKYFFAYSIACDPFAFDNAGPVHGWIDDSIAEDLVVGEYGAFAVVMNTRYGWGYGNSTDGPGTAFEREFVDAIFGEGHRSLGKALADSKEDNIWRINQDCMRWTYYTSNLCGDPEIEIKPPEVEGNDAGVREINAPGEVSGTGANTANATIRNYGINDLTNFMVNFSVYSIRRTTLFYDDMESGDSKWTVVDNDGDGDTWTIVEPSEDIYYSSPTHSFKCTPGSTYKANADDDLISQAIDCTGHDSITVEFYVWSQGQYDGWTGDYLDRGTVSLSDDGGATWVDVVGKLNYINFEGNLPGLRYSFPVEEYVDLTDEVKIKFNWVSDGSTHKIGMFVDDVVFYATDVLSLIDSSNVVVSSLDSGEQTYVTSTWNAPSAGWYLVNISTRLGGDENALNNYQTQLTYVKASDDLGVESISPVGLHSTGTY